MPEISAQRSRTQAKPVSRRIICSRPLAIVCQVVLIACHISVDSVSRARRALSRAADSVEITEASDPKS